jgi:hypothetical protein
LPSYARVIDVAHKAGCRRPIHGYVEDNPTQ